MIGTTLGHYRILEALGAGGMGQVYLAEDFTLNRRVALKVLPPELAVNPGLPTSSGSPRARPRDDRRERFALEAKAIAALDHPNIVTVHSLEEAGGIEFITMEVVRGRTLADLIPRHGMKLGDVLTLAVPLADAVSAAHQRGILHRDLKPSNVMVTDEGRVKVLDFGLAKLKEKEEPAPSPITTTGTAPPFTGSDTTGANRPITGAGRIVGTVAYMSPEQAEGRPVDHRSDIFSLGVILYEMATGGRPFQGDSAASVLAAILRDTPRPVNAVNPNVPRELARVVRRCLTKDRERRYQSAKDLRNDLEELKQESDSGELAAARLAPGATARRFGPIHWFVGAAAVVALITGALFVDRLVRGPARGGSAVEATFTQLTFQEGLKTWPSLSPDGKWFAYSANSAPGNTDIFLQSAGGRNAINLTRDSAAADYQPAFSPNGEHIAFRSERQGGGIFVMGRTGESVKRITDAGYDPAWSPDGREIVFSTVSSNWDPYIRRGVGELWIAAVANGRKRRLHEGDALQPQWSPHGDRIAYWGLPPGTTQRDIWTIPAKGGAPAPVTNDAALDCNPIWSPSDKHLYFSSDRGGTLNVWRVPVDEDTGKVVGPLQPMTTPSAYVGHLSISRDGLALAYVGFLPDSNILRFDFDPVSGTVRGGATRITTGTPGKDVSHVSPDGEWLVYRTYPQQEDLVICRADGSDPRQLTDDAARDRAPRWSPDGTRVAFASDRTGIYQIWVINPDGSNLTQVTDTSTGSFPNHPLWSPDGTRMAISDVRVSAVTLFDPRRPWRQQTPEVLPPPPGGVAEFFVAKSWSRDGRRLAGTLGQGLAVYSFDSRAYEILADRSGVPCWLSDGRRLLYPVGNRLMLMDTVTKRSREVLSIEPDATLNNPSTGPGDLHLFITRQAWDSNIWLATIKQ